MERVSLQFRRGTLSDSKFDKSTSTSTTASLNSTLDSRLSFHSFLEVLWISDGVLSLFCFSFALHTLLSALHNRGVSGFFGVIIIALADESMNTRADTNDIRTNGRMWRMSIDLSLLFLVSLSDTYPYVYMHVEAPGTTVSAAAHRLHSHRVLLFKRVYTLTTPNVDQLFAWMLGICNDWLL